VREGSSKIEGVVDCLNAIVRVKNTLTTHMKKNQGKDNFIYMYSPHGEITENDGSQPYPGITRDTCKIDDSNIVEKYVILVDDIYTRGCNIDEDCIQFLYDNGAKKVLLYTIGFTQIGK
jgi:orotate phosphoribosyltransferase-like protein